MSFPHFSVIKTDGTLVPPSKPTPTHTLPLSWFDTQSMQPMLVETLLVFKQGQEPAQHIKKALAIALINYYPLAGRLIRSDYGAITQVDCTGDGVWFVEATANCKLEAIMGLLEENAIPSDYPMNKLFPSPPNPDGMSIMLQVTQFDCGGFVIGLKYDHIMADGIGIAQIMKAIGDIARGLKQPVVPPVWLRDQLPNPPSPNRSPAPLPSTKLLYHTVDISQDHINRLKDQFMEKTGENCSTFDIVIAHLWQCRTRAISMDPIVNARLLFPANTRNLLCHLFPDGITRGYYGNCLYPIIVASASGKIAQSSVIDVIILIRDAKKRMPENYSEWAEGALKASNEAMTMSGYDSLFVSDWRTLGLHEIDYGWGGPSYYATPPIRLGMDYPPLCVMIKPPTPKEGCRLVTRCVKMEHFKTFNDLMLNI